MTVVAGIADKRLLDIMNNTADHTVVATGIVEVRAAQRLVNQGLAIQISENNRSVDQWGAGSMRIQRVEIEEVS